MRNPLWAPEYTGWKPNFNDRGCIRLNLDHLHNKGLLGWWLFNEHGGQVLNSLTGRFPGVITGSTWERSTRGHVLTTNGTSDSVAIADPESKLSPSTMTIVTDLCVRSGVGNNDRIFEKKITWVDTNGWDLEIALGATSFYTIGSGSTMLSLYLTWTQDIFATYAFTYSGTTVRAYKNGAYAEQGTIDALVQNSNSLRFALGDNNSRWTPLTFNYVMLYDRALTAQEISQLYRAPYGTPNNPRLLVEPRRIYFVPALGGVTGQFAPMPIFHPAGS